MIASIAFDRTGSYDGFMVAMAVILVVSGLLVYSITGPDERLRARLLAASPSAP